MKEARSLWESTNNTDSMNYLIASGRERSALIVEVRVRVIVRVRALRLRC